MMVAYSFNKIFADQVEQKLKNHTIRAHRKRHARPGEPVQLYTGMQTRHCRKLVNPDPLCERVDDISIVVAEDGHIDQITINGIPLSNDESESLAMADGFDPAFVYSKAVVSKDAAAEIAAMDKDGRAPIALRQMGQFWLESHGAGQFDGVIIHWEHRRD